MLYSLVGLALILGFIRRLLFFELMIWLSQWMALQDLKSQGRALAWSVALERVLNSDGFFVENLVPSLPGRIWWIPSSPSDDFGALFVQVRDSGWVVVGFPKFALRDPRLSGQIFTLEPEPLCSAAKSGSSES
jgi:hypothetical protein